MNIEDTIQLGKIIQKNIELVDDSPFFRKQKEISNKIDWNVTKEPFTTDITFAEKTMKKCVTIYEVASQIIENLKKKIMEDMTEVDCNDENIQKSLSKLLVRISYESYDNPTLLENYKKIERKNQILKILEANLYSLQLSLSLFKETFDR
jgi:hypothetical protein